MLSLVAATENSELQQTVISDDSHSVVAVFAFDTTRIRPMLQRFLGSARRSHRVETSFDNSCVQLFGLRIATNPLPLTRPASSLTWLSQRLASRRGLARPVYSRTLPDRNVCWLIRESHFDYTVRLRFGGRTQRMGRSLVLLL